MANKIDCRPIKFRSNKYPKNSWSCIWTCPYWFVCGRKRKKPKKKVTKKEYMLIYNKENKERLVEYRRAYRKRNIKRLLENEQIHRKKMKEIKNQYKDFTVEELKFFLEYPEEIGCQTDECKKEIKEIKKVLKIRKK